MLKLERYTVASLLFEDRRVEEVAVITSVRQTHPPRGMEGWRRQGEGDGNVAGAIYRGTEGIYWEPTGRRAVRERSDRVVDLNVCVVEHR